MVMQRDLACATPVPAMRQFRCRAAPRAAATRIAIRGDLLDFTAAPAWGDVESPAVRFRPDHWLLVEDGRIVARAGRAARTRAGSAHDHRGRLVLPGFIDTHVHSPQIDVIASYGTELLDWLDDAHLPGRGAPRRRGACRGRRRRTSSMRCSRTARPRRSSSRPCTPASVDALFAAAEARGMRLIAGKVLMDRNAPADLRRRRRRRPSATARS